MSRCSVSGWCPKLELIISYDLSAPKGRPLGAVACSREPVRSLGDRANKHLGHYDFFGSSGVSPVGIRYIRRMHTEKRNSTFQPHGTARAGALAGTPLESFGERAAAFAIDFFSVLVTYVPVELARQYLVLSLRHQKLDIHGEFNFHEVGNLVWLVLYFGLIVWKTNGFTPGKRLLPIRVVSLVHNRVTLWQAVERAVGYGASVLELGTGFLQYFIHPNRCCVHDRIAETIVVKDRGELSAAPAPAAGQ